MDPQGKDLGAACVTNKGLIPCLSGFLSSSPVIADTSLNGIKLRKICL